MLLRDSGWIPGRCGEIERFQSRILVIGRGHDEWNLCFGDPNTHWRRMIERLWLWMSEESRI